MELSTTPETIKDFWYPISDSFDGLNNKKGTAYGTFELDLTKRLFIKQALTSTGALV